jgi:hypothetical protein
MKISRKNWEKSKEKWGGKLILQKMRDKVPFDDETGWNDLVIQSASNCGYCVERKNQAISCFDCSLDSEEGCSKHYYAFVEEIGTSTKII